MIYRKIISVILSIVLVFSPLIIHAEELEEATQSAIQSVSETEPQSQEIATAEPELQTENEADVERTIEAEAITGGNVAEDNIISETQTGDATASANVEAVVNVNKEGDNIDDEVIAIYGDHAGDIDISDQPACSGEIPQEAYEDGQLTKEYIQRLYDALYASNKAKIVNNVNLTAQSGGNVSDDVVNIINTGDADAIANIFNLANINLVGNCGFFGIVNVFGNQTGDIILPKTEAYLGSPTESGGSTQQNKPAIVSEIAKLGGFNISNNNSAVIANNVFITANTGDNTTDGVAVVNTGASISDMRLLDMANMNIIGNRWALVIVNYYGEWEGEVRGWSGNSESKPHSLLLWIQLPDKQEAASEQSTSEKETQPASIATNNDAVVTNNVTLNADTGNNRAHGRYSDVKTGRARAIVNEFTLANTNIIGNNWFFSVINIFGNFLGDLVFGKKQTIQTASRPIVTPTPSRIGGAEVYLATPTPTPTTQVLGATTSQSSPHRILSSRFTSKYNQPISREIIVSKNNPSSELRDLSLLSISKKKPTNLNDYCVNNVAICSGWGLVGTAPIVALQWIIRRRLS